MKYYDYTKKLKSIINSNKDKQFKKMKLRYLKYSLDKSFNQYDKYYFDSRKRLKKEIEFLKIIESKTGYTVYLIPKSKIQNVKTPDFWIKELNEVWDLKCVYGNGKNRINNIFYKSKQQTENIIIKIENMYLDCKRIKKDIINIFENNKHKSIKKVILVDFKNELVLYYKR